MNSCGPSWSVVRSGSETRDQTIVARRHVALHALHTRVNPLRIRKPLPAVSDGHLGRAIQPRHDRLIAAIGHVVNQHAVAARKINRLQNAEFALVFT